MSDEISVLRKENIELKKFVEKLEGKIVELEEKNGKLLDQNAKLVEENNSLRVEKSQENTEKSLNAIQNLQPLKRSHEKDVSNLLEINKKPKFTTKRFVPNWLIDVMEWIKRIEMANSALSTSCVTFKQLCWPKLHLNVKPHKMANLECSRATYELGKWKVFLFREDVDTDIPIASIPPPNYIIGIRRIDINILDDRIMNFAKCISHMFENCYLKFNSKIISCNMDNALLVPMKALIASLTEKIYQIELWQGWQLNNFVRLFPGALENAQFLLLFDATMKDIDIIMNWLSNHSNIGKQKLIRMSPNREMIEALINGIKMEFTNANLPFIFLIDFRHFNSNINLFRLENERTNEILKLYFLRGYYYLARYPKGEGHWKEEGRKKMDGHGMPILQTLNFSHK